MDGNKPFTLTLKSATVKGAKRVFNFKSVHPFDQWLLRLRGGDDSSFGASSSESLRSIDSSFRDAFHTFVPTFEPIEGGCNFRSNDTTDKEFTSKYFTYKLHNPKSNHNNCGIVAVQYLFDDFSVKCSDIRKALKFGKSNKLTPDDLDKVHKYLCKKLGRDLDYPFRVIEKENNVCYAFPPQPLIMYTGLGHYSVATQVAGVKIEKKKTKRGELFFDIETRASTTDYMTIGKGTKSYFLKDTLLKVWCKPYKGKFHMMTYKYNTEQDISCCRQFLDWLKDEGQNGRSYTCYAHNGSRFDMYFMLAAMNDEETKDAYLGFRGLSLINMGLWNNTFKDTCCFLTDSLSNLCKAYKVDTSKMAEANLRGTIMGGYELCMFKPELDIPEFMELEKSDPEFWALYEEYCELDVISLQQIWDKFKEQFNSIIDKMNPFLHRTCSLNGSTTIGSLSKKMLDNLNMFNKVHKPNMKYMMRFVNDDENKYEFVSKFKRGGISHCNQPGKHYECVVSYDIVSQYPAALLYMLIPSGYSHWTDKYDEKCYGFYHVTDLKFDGSMSFKPIAESIAGKSLNWKTENTLSECHIDSEMLKYLKLNCGLVSFQIKQGLVSYQAIQGSKLFGTYVETLFNEKAEQDTLKDAGLEYNCAYRSAIKLFLNSVTGKLVEDPSRYFTLNNVLNGTKNVNGVRFSPDTKPKMNEWLTAGCMVYSYSKRLLFENIKCLPNQDADVIHVETDSMYFAQRHEEKYLENISQYRGEYPIGIGSALGNMSKEHSSENVSYFIGKKNYTITSHGNTFNKVKGIPSQTLSEDGKVIKLINETFYSRQYNYEPVTVEYKALRKDLTGRNHTGRACMSAHTTSRTVKPQARGTFKEYH